MGPDMFLKNAFSLSWTGEDDGSQQALRGSAQSKALFVIVSPSIDAVQHVFDRLYWLLEVVEELAKWSLEDLLKITQLFTSFQEMAKCVKRYATPRRYSAQKWIFTTHLVKLGCWRAFSDRTWEVYRLAVVGFHTTRFLQETVGAFENSRCHQIACIGKQFRRIVGWTPSQILGEGLEQGNGCQS